MNKNTFFVLLDVAFRKWLHHNASLKAAALAYFIILPFPLLLLIILTIFSLIYGQGGAFEVLIQQITTFAGPVVAELIKQLLEAFTSPFDSLLTSLVSLVFTIVGATGAFGVLKDTINEIWEVPRSKRSLSERLKRNIIPFSIIFVLGVTMIIWTILTTLLTGFMSAILYPFASDIISIILRITQIGLSFALASLLFAIVYKQIPDVTIRWKDVKIAAIITSLMFTSTNYLIGMVIENFTITSLQGTAGVLIILLLWLYLINQFIIYGAAFSNVYTRKLGSRSLKQEK